MRTIKFRAWDWDAEKMLYDVGVFNGEARVDVSTEDDRDNLTVVLYETENYPLMQFTGLLDSKGKEIYEGDIFMDEEDGTCDFVDWNEHYGGWGTNQWMLPEELVAYSKDMEVIGNLFENPELISDKK